MKSNPFLTLTPLMGLLALFNVATFAHADSMLPAFEQVKKIARTQIHQIIDPVFTKYCSDECKLLAIEVEIDVATADTIAPGFDEIDSSAKSSLEPASAEVKVLIDEKIGPNTRTRVLDLVNRYLETLDYPVKISTKLARFPSPAESAQKVTELRDRVTRQFKGAMEELVSKYCPKDCLFSEYDLQTELVNIEEAQYGNSGEYFESGGVAIRVKSVGGTLLMEESIPDGDRANLLAMARMKVNSFKNAELRLKPMKFPRVGGETGDYANMGTYVGADGKSYGKNSLSNRESKETTEQSRSEKSLSEQNRNSTEQTSNNTDSKSALTQTSNSENKINSSNTSKDQRTENFQHYEKIERVENGDALTTEFKSMRTYAAIFAAIILSMLAFIAFSTLRSRQTIEMNGLGGGAAHSMPALPPMHTAEAQTSETHAPPTTGGSNVLRRYDIDRLRDELMSIFAEQPRVAKYVFGRILTEEGIETTSGYISIFGESIVLDLLRDPSLQHDLNELMEFYARTPIELDDEERLDLLKKLHHRTVAGKMAVVVSRSSVQFDFLAEMDGMQILELVRNESMTVKAIVLTQCDNQKRAAIFTAIDEATKMRLLAELSRIDYLPRDYIQNVAVALKRKRQENPRLNTEALPGSDVLVNLLERSEPQVQQTVMKNLEMNNPDSARVVKHKLVSIDTLAYLPDGQLLEIILSLRHEELLQFLKGSRADVRQAIFGKCPKDLVSDLEEELESFQNPSRDIYGALERKVLNRVKMMAQDSLVNLADVNDRLFAAYGANDGTNVSPLRKAG